MIGRIVRWGCAVITALTLAGCADGEQRTGASNAGEAQQPAATGTQDVEYTMAALDDFQHTALSQFALSRMSNGVVPDVAMVVSPQPPGVPAGKLLVGVRYDECGHTLGRATITDGVLVIEKRPPPDRGATGCGGTTMAVGVLVTLPPDTTVNAARVEPTGSAGT